MIRQATEKDICYIEGILQDAVTWMDHIGFSNLWNFENTRWASLSLTYKISDFYLYIIENEPLGCMALAFEDKEFWPEIPYGEAIYIHKLAVKREASGKGISREFIDFLKSYARNNSISSIRLDCNAANRKLRELYEKEGFLFVKNIVRQDDYELALYIFSVVV